MDRPLMPKATAMWLVENTSLTFEQIADFCGLHPLEVQGIADGEVGAGIRGLDPVSGGQLTREEIARCQQDPKARLQLARPAAAAIKPSRRKEPRYTPLSKRQDRPNAIMWLVRNHPELKDAQISRLVGTTKSTIEQIRNRTHWNAANLVPMDPVTLGLCSQIDLDLEVQRASRGREPAAPTGDTLLPASLTERLTPEQPKPKSEDDELDADAVFAKLSALKSKDGDSDEE